MNIAGKLHDLLQAFEINAGALGMNVVYLKLATGFKVCALFVLTLREKKAEKVTAKIV